MSDMPNEFWGGWIAVVTIISIIGLLWVMVSVVFVDTGPQEAEDAVWDENLREGSSPAPVWWFWLTLALLIFSAIYLMLYPGLGSYRGALDWSMGHHLEGRQHDFEQHFGARRASIAGMSINLLQRDSEAMRAAQGIYNRNCAVCHGYDAAGQADLFPDLTDDDWQWGGSAAEVERSIRDGRQAVMVSWTDTIGADGVDQVVDYVASLGDGPAGEHPGAAIYQQYCIACHGPTGTGMAALGAPNLTDDVWLYGGTRDAIHASVANGRNGEMPAFGERLDDAQIRMLVAWLLK